MKNIILFLIIISPLIGLSCKNKKESYQLKIQERQLSHPIVVINQDTLSVEISDTQEKRKIGLMFRDKLEWNKGMLFIFDEETSLEFWMKNTRIPLSIAFINSKYVIVDIQQMKPFSKDTYLSKFPALYALEVNKGWFKQHNIKAGEMLSIHF